MLRGGRYRKIVASTVPEIEGSLPLVAEGILDEVRLRSHVSKPQTYKSMQSVSTGCQSIQEFYHVSAD